MIGNEREWLTSCITCSDTDWRNMMKLKSVYRKHLIIDNAYDPTDKKTYNPVSARALSWAKLELSDPDKYMRWYAGVSEARTTYHAPIRKATKEKRTAYMRNYMAERRAKEHNEALINAAKSR